MQKHYKEMQRLVGKNIVDEGVKMQIIWLKTVTALNEKKQE